MSYPIKVGASSHGVLSSPIFQPQYHLGGGGQCPANTPWCSCLRLSLSLHAPPPPHVSFPSPAPPPFPISPHHCRLYRRHIF